MTAHHASVWGVLCLLLASGCTARPAVQSVEGVVVRITHSAPDCFPAYRGLSVTFEDGRQFTFWGDPQPFLPMVIGQRYRFEFDKENRLVRVMEK